MPSSARPALAMTLAGGGAAPEATPRAVAPPSPHCAMSMYGWDTLVVDGDALPLPLRPHTSPTLSTTGSPSLSCSGQRPRGVSGASARGRGETPPQGGGAGGASVAAQGGGAGGASVADDNEGWLLPSPTSVIFGSPTPPPSANTSTLPSRQPSARAARFISHDTHGVVAKHVAKLAAAKTPAGRAHSAHAARSSSVSARAMPRLGLSPFPEATEQGEVVRRRIRSQEHPPSVYE